MGAAEILLIFLVGCFVVPTAIMTAMAAHSLYRESHPYSPCSPQRYHSLTASRPQPQRPTMTVRSEPGRHLAAWLGLVPRQCSSGGKSRLLGISKRGDRYVRTLLIHGARAVVVRAGAKPDARSRWIAEKRRQRGTNRACVAVANKNARIIWALLAHDTCYQKAA